MSHHVHLQRRRGRLGPRRAFSLVELVLVITIIGILSAIAMPRFTGFVTHQRAESAARRIAMDLTLARRQARVSNTIQRVRFAVASDTYSVPGLAGLNRSGQPYTVRLSEEPYLADVLSADFGGDPEVVFDPYGLPDTGGSVRIRVGAFVKVVVVDPTTGRAYVP